MTRLRAWLARTAILIASTAIAGAAAELVYRQVAPEPARLICRDAERREVGMDRLGDAKLFEANPHVPPGRSHRNAPAPSAVFYFCFERPKRAYFDADGCVENRINSRGIRDREELCQPKPPGQRRILCVGDSFTFGWGVRIEDAWVRLVEDRLRAEVDDGVRTVNCGVTSGLFPDEYSLALRERLGVFEPDAVLVTLCLNDLIPSFNVLSHREPAPLILRKSRLIGDLMSSYSMRAQLWIDPSRDVVEELLALGPEFYPVIPWLGLSGVGRDEMWAGGGPQRALVEMRDWCKSRGIGFGVSIWPYLQGLGPSAHYPFGTVHRLVREFCADHGIPFHDVLPSLRGHGDADLWVHPADLHPNERAHALAAPGIAGFARTLLDG